MDPNINNFLKDATLGFVSFLVGWISKHYSEIGGKKK